MKQSYLFDSYLFWSAVGFYSMDIVCLDYDPPAEITILVKELLWLLLVFQETRMNELLKRLRATLSRQRQGSVCLYCA